MLKVSRVTYQVYVHDIVSGVAIGQNNFVYAVSLGNADALLDRITSMNIELVEGNLIATREILEFLDGARKFFSVIPKFLWGTPFQRRAWFLTANIPYGTTITYSELAKRSASPKASRAAGSAMAKNHIPLIVPCHRVVAVDGIGGFGDNVELKRKLLELEKSSASPNSDRKQTSIVK